MRFGFQVNWRWTSLALVLVGGNLGLNSSVLVRPVLAQNINPKLAADEVYRQVPDFPLENQYIRKKGNKSAKNTTLISRLIQYHTLVKGRSPLYRFDWKLTLADYLGIYENIREETYPGHSYLKTNPLARDRKLIQQLSRQQRLVLIQSLSDIYLSQVRQQDVAEPQEAPPQNSTQPTQPPVPQLEPEPAKPSRPTLIPLPGSGGADLLRSPTPSEPAQPTAPQSPEPSSSGTQTSEESNQLSF